MKGENLTLSRCILFAVFALVAARAQTAPANDMVENRISLVGLNIRVTGSNIGATSELDELAPITGNSGGKSLWWSWQAPAHGSVWIETIGSDFDTLLAVFTGDSLASLARVTQDDDSGGLGTSSIPTPGTGLFIATSGAAYQIVAMNHPIYVAGLIDRPMFLKRATLATSATLDDPLFVLGNA